MIHFKKYRSKLLLMLCVLGVLNILFGALLFIAKRDSVAAPLPQQEDTTTNFPELAQVNQLKTFSDITTYFKSLAQKKGAEYAYNVLRVATLPPNTDLHLLGHTVGDILFEQKGVDGIKICTDDFRNACSHSIVVAMFLKDGVSALEKITKVCQQAPGGSGAYTMCFHGLGHGVLAFTKYNLEEAVALCKLAGSEKYNYREYPECVGGAIMEMMAGIHDPDLWNMQKGKYLSDTNPLMPCSMSIIPEEAKALCYIYLTPHLFEAAQVNMNEMTPDGITRAFASCDKVPEENFRSVCYGGFGKEFVGLAQSRDIRNVENMKEEQLQKVIDWCSYAKNGIAIAVCHEHVVQSLYWGGENKPDATILFCSMLRDDIEQTSCFQTFLNSVRNYASDKDIQQRICKSLPVQKQHLCQENV